MEKITKPAKNDVAMFDTATISESLKWDENEEKLWFIMLEY